MKVIETYFSKSLSLAQNVILMKIINIFNYNTKDVLLIDLQQ
jgi:hypothetical protein